MLSTATWIVILFVLVIIKYVFIQTMEDKEVYKLYATRDELALASIDSKINQDSEIYEFLVNYLNFWIFYSKNDYDFSIVIKNILKIEQVQKVQEKLNQEMNGNEIAISIIKKTEPQVKWVIGVKGFIFTHIFVRFIIIMLEILLRIIEIVIYVFDKGHQTSKKINNYIDKSRRMQSECDSSRAIYKRMI